MLSFASCSVKPVLYLCHVHNRFWARGPWSDSFYDASLHSWFGSGQKLRSHRDTRTAAFVTSADEERVMVENCPIDQLSLGRTKFQVNIPSAVRLESAGRAQTRRPARPSAVLARAIGAASHGANDSGYCVCAIQPIVHKSHRAYWPVHRSSRGDGWLVRSAGIPSKTVIPGSGLSDSPGFLRCNSARDSVEQH